MAGRDIWMPLSSFNCPVTGCPGNRFPKNWVCSIDNTDMFVSQNGILCCRVGHTGRIMDWKFDCGNHGNHSVRRWQTTDIQGFSYALSYATQMSNSAGATWVASLILSLGTQYQ
ncbi:uncharacterized protein LOC134689601 [Mytilus trossulus]|uniref:uncharacterized protein LOC134689601 n=1 Tax=Mytilus trossulus TaxID=6551 RepID=UPI0030040807